jgi:hypothetical protein
MVGDQEDPGAHESSNAPEAHVLPLLGTEDGDGLVVAARELVKRKRAFEEFTQNRSDHWKVPSCLYRELVLSLDSMDFLRAAIPFIEQRKFCRQIRARAPSDRVMGEGWKRYRAEHDPNLIRDRIKELSAPRMADPSFPPHAEYIWLRPLGFFIAHEGKNRVSFFVDNSIAEIPAVVSEYSYPAADRIQRFNVSIAGRNELWAVLDGRYVERVELPLVSQQLLDAYGVAVAAPWPSRWPCVEVVASAFFCSSTSAGSLRTADMGRLRGKREGSSRARVAVFDLVIRSHALRVRATWVGLAVLAACFVCILTAGAGSGSFAVFSLGCCIGATVVLSLSVSSPAPDSA